MTKCACGFVPEHDKEHGDHAMTIVMNQLRLDRERQDKEDLWMCLKCGGSLDQEIKKTNSIPRFGKMRIHRSWKCPSCGEINNKIHFEDLIKK